MRICFGRLTCVVLTALLHLGNNAGVAQTFRGELPPIPTLTGPIYDETGTLSEDEKSALEQKVLSFRDSTSTEIVVMIVATTNDFPASDYAVAAAQKNKLGEKGKDNGALLLIAKDDHKIFLAPGYGLEPTLTDAISSQIITNILRPAFRAGEYYQGIDSAISAIILATRGEFQADKKNARGRGEPSAIAILIIVGGFIFVIGTLGAIAGNGAHRTVVGRGGSKQGLLGGILQAIFWASIMNSGRRKRGPWDKDDHSGFGGGGFGGGGFGGGGGWSSGGGGGFGGGGAGGSW